MILHHIDEPVRWDNPTPLLFVRGWCLATEGEDLIGIAGRTPHGSWDGVYKFPRPDVARAFKDNPHAEFSGFSLRVPRPEGGEKWLQIEARIGSDQVQVLSRHAIT